ncbi:unnamed protein product [Lota lota]
MLPTPRASVTQALTQRHVASPHARRQLKWRLAAFLRPPSLLLFAREELLDRTKEGSEITEEDAENGDPTDLDDREVQENKMNALTQKHQSKCLQQTNLFSGPFQSPANPHPSPSHP